MILEIKKWCEGIIVAVIISIIIEMIIPNGNNKKYIKVIIGVYIMYVSLSPILEFLKYDFNFDEILNFETAETFQTDNKKISDIYIIGMENTLKYEIKELGYNVQDVKITTDINYEEIEKIELKINGKLNEISPVNINKNSENNQNYKDIIELIETNYLVNSNNIIFK